MSTAPTYVPSPTPDLAKIERALISVSDKTGLVELGKALAAHGVAILSTGGSAKTLRDAGVEVIEVSDHTGFPEIMDGRVKTLQPAIHGGILARRTDTGHAKAMSDHKIAAIDLVVVNLYPVRGDGGARRGLRDLRREHRHRRAGADPRLGQEPRLRHRRRRSRRLYIGARRARGAQGATTLALRRKLAAKAYARTAAYDSAIATWFARQQRETFPEQLTIAAERVQILRYGENPHQQAAFYADGSKRPGVATARQVQGKELSYKQHQRHRRGLRVRGRVQRARRRRDQARQPERRGDRGRPVQRLSQGLCLRPGIDLRRHRRGQSHARGGDGDRPRQAFPRSDHRA
jgi:phosphoribosylaminoimidazolecarboxamide formyltransferase/IMP cyclohydrolase